MSALSDFDEAETRIHVVPGPFWMWVEERPMPRLLREAHQWDLQDARCALTECGSRWAVLSGRDAIFLMRPI